MISNCVFGQSTPLHSTPSLLHINIHPHLPQISFANRGFTMPRGVFAAQAQYLVHSGLPTTSNHSQTAGHFVCTGVAFRAFLVFLLTVIYHASKRFCCTGAVLGAFWAANDFQPFSDRGLFCMHRRCVSCIFCVFANCDLSCLEAFLLRRRSTWCILGCQ